MGQQDSETVTFKHSQHYRRQQSPESAVSFCSSFCILFSHIHGSAVPRPRFCIRSAWGSSFFLGSPFPHLCSVFPLHEICVLFSLFMSCPFLFPWFSIPTSLFCVPSSLVLHSLIFVLRSFFLGSPFPHLCSAFPLPGFSVPPWVRVLRPVCSGPTG